MFNTDMVAPHKRETADLGVLGNRDSISELLAEQSSKQETIDNDKSNNDPAQDLKF